MDRKKFREIMALLFTTFRQSIDPQLADSYYFFLKEYSLEDVRKAVVSLIKTEKFFPSVSQIIGEIVGEECSEMEMKQDVIDAIQTYGSYKSPQFKYQISHAIADDIGWMNMCNMREKELGDLLHFKYKNVSEEWKKCKQLGEEFILPAVKGRHELRGGGGNSARQLDVASAINKLKEE